MERCTVSVFQNCCQLVTICHIVFYLVTLSPISSMSDFGVFSNSFIALTMPLNAVLIFFHAHNCIDGVCNHLQTMTPCYV